MAIAVLPTAVGPKRATTVARTTGSLADGPVGLAQ
jgi:hypothetical protein